jgi:hypothetical protein
MVFLSSFKQVSPPIVCGRSKGKFSNAFVTEFLLRLLRSSKNCRLTILPADC